MNTVYLSLGSNIGHREHYLKAGIDELKKIGTVEKVSSLYNTKPEGGVAKHMFLNACIKLNTKLGAFELLRYCLKIEKKYGRIRKIKWDDRTLDIDIITFNDLNIATKSLSLPHPYAKGREFVMKPLREIGGIL